MLSCPQGAVQLHLIFIVTYVLLPTNATALFHYANDRLPLSPEMFFKFTFSVLVVKVTSATHQ